MNKFLKHEFFTLYFNILKFILKIDRNKFYYTLLFESILSILVFVEMLFYYYVIMLIMNISSLNLKFEEIGISSPNHYLISFCFIVLLLIFNFLNYKTSILKRVLAEKVHIAFLNNAIEALASFVKSDYILNKEEKQYLKSKLNNTAVLVGKSIEAIIPILKHFTIIIVGGIALFTIDKYLTSIIITLILIFIPFFFKISKKIKQVSESHFLTTAKEFNQYISKTLKKIFANESNNDSILDNQTSKEYFFTFHHFLIANEKTSLAQAMLKTFILLIIVNYILMQTNGDSLAFMVVYFFILKQFTASMQNIIAQYTNLVRYYGLINDYTKKFPKGNLLWK